MMHSWLILLLFISIISKSCQTSSSLILVPYSQAAGFYEANRANWGQKEVLQGRRGLAGVLANLSPGQLLPNITVQRGTRTGQGVKGPPFRFFESHPCGQGADRGVCLSFTNCFWFRGTRTGSNDCGLLTCCKFSGSCGDTTTSSVSHFNDDKRTSKSPNCIFKVRINRRRNICQLRLDWQYLNLKLTLPATTSNCDDHSSLVVRGSKPEVSICGENSNPSHFYANVPKDPETISIEISKAVDSLWSITVTQIECNSPKKAPIGCSQYHLEKQGVAHGYKLADKGGKESGYAICFSGGRGSCKVDYDKITSEFGALPTATDPDKCVRPYLVIPGATYTDTTGALKVGSTFCKSIDNVISPTFQLTYVPKDTWDSTQEPFKVVYKITSNGCP